MLSAQSYKPVDSKDDFARKLEDLKQGMKKLKKHSPYEVLGVSDIAYDFAISSACLIKKSMLEDEDTPSNQFYYHVCELARDVLLDKLNRGREEFPPQKKYVHFKKLGLFKVDHNAQSAINELNQLLKDLNVADPYELLKITRDATEVDIIARYEEILKREEDCLSTDFVYACNIARNLLLTPETRAQFDVVPENAIPSLQKQF